MRALQLNISLGSLSSTMKNEFNMFNFEWALGFFYYGSIEKTLLKRPILLRFFSKRRFLKSESSSDLILTENLFDWPKVF